MNHAPFRRRLQDELHELQSASEQGRADRAPPELDQQSIGRLSRMDAMQVQAMAQETERRRRQRIAMIEAALARLETGDYGVCVICDEEIAPARLAFDPAVATCIRCAQQAG